MLHDCGRQGTRSMPHFPGNVALAPAVQSIQAEQGSRASYARKETKGGCETLVTPELESSLADLDMFWLGTSSAEGQPCL
jgi:hypothetical protein